MRWDNHGWKFKTTKILNFQNSSLKTWGMPTDYSQFSSSNGQLSLDRLSINQRTNYNLTYSAFWGWLSTESQPQNPEFRNNYENFHPWIIQKHIHKINAWHHLACLTPIKSWCIGESSTFKKSWTFEILILKHAICLQSNNNFKFK